MNENETIANVSPKLGKILARLVRAQEDFPKNEPGEDDHNGEPPIGMKPREEANPKTAVPDKEGMDEREKKAIERVLAQA